MKLAAGIMTAAALVSMVACRESPSPVPVQPATAAPAVSPARKMPRAQAELPTTDAALAVAPSYPKTEYVVTSGNKTAGNVSGMVFGFAEPSYLAGMVAGAMTKTNRLGVIGGTELPPVRESFLAFIAGVHRVNPKARVVTSYIGNWDDVSAGKEQALAQLASGVDVIFQNADAAGLGRV